MTKINVKENGWRYERASFKSIIPGEMISLNFPGDGEVFVFLVDRVDDQERRFGYLDENGDETLWQSVGRMSPVWKIFPSI